MFVDASAMVAILASEEDAGALAARLGQAQRAYTSPVAIYETVLGLARVTGMRGVESRALVSEFLDEAGIETILITDSIADMAIDAFDRFGKGRHKAALNLGDCFAYACALALESPLLFKGQDFPQTDVTVA